MCFRHISTHPYIQCQTLPLKGKDPQIWSLRPLLGRHYTPSFAIMLANVRVERLLNLKIRNFQITQPKQSNKGHDFHNNSAWLPHLNISLISKPPGDPHTQSCSNSAVLCSYQAVDTTHKNISHQIPWKLNFEWIGVGLRNWKDMIFIKCFSFLSFCHIWRKEMHSTNVLLDFAWCLCHKSEKCGNLIKICFEKLMVFIKCQNICKWNKFTPINYLVFLWQRH